MSDEYINLPKHPKSTSVPGPKASDLIKSLQEAIREYGDLTVLIESPYLGGAFNSIHLVNYEEGYLLLCYCFDN